MANITIGALPVKSTEAIAADILHIVTAGIDNQIPMSLIAASVSTLLSLGTAATKDTGILNGEIPLIGAGNKLLTSLIDTGVADGQIAQVGAGNKLNNAILNNSAEGTKGIAEIISQANANLDVNDTDILTILKLVTRTATTSKKAMVEFLTNGEMGAGTDATRAANAANILSLFNASTLATDSIAKFPINVGGSFDELFIQFGSMTTGTGFITETLPQAFPNAFIWVHPVQITSGHRDFNVDILSTSQFRVEAIITGSTSVRYMAIGR